MLIDYQLKNLSKAILYCILFIMMLMIYFICVYQFLLNLINIDVILSHPNPDVVSLANN